MNKLRSFVIVLFLLSQVGISFAQILQKNPVKNKNQNPVPTYQERQAKSLESKDNITWTGSINSDWHTAGNWSTGNVPTSSDNVIIAVGTPNDPVIFGGYAYCNNIYHQEGSSLSQNSGSYFYCHGTFDAGFGQFTMNGTSYLYLSGANNELWWDDYQDDTYTNVRILKSSSTATLTMKNDMTCSGTFEIREGVFQIDNESALNVTNTGNEAFEVEDGGKLHLDAIYEQIWVDGDVVFRDGSQFYSYGGGIFTEGNFKVESNTLYDIEFEGLSVLGMRGSNNQYIQDEDGGNLKLVQFTVDKPAGTCYIANADLHSWSIHIYSGTLSCRSSAGSTTVWDIYNTGSWFNYVGDAGFEEATGRVIFNGGDYNQFCPSETFNELEIDKPLGGSLAIDLGYDVVCSAYDWTAGALEVLDGSFTALDLLDNAVQGEFILHPEGEINLTNSGGIGNEYVDLKGDLQIYGGTMNVTGSLSYWPYQEDASIEMSGGILDFNCDGIQIDENGFALDDNITGGTIRTSGYFQGNRADFTPTAGIFELYGSSDANISQLNGSTLYNLNIDKSAKSNLQNQKPDQMIIDERSGEIISDGGKSNTVTMGSNLHITNDLLINTGVLATDNNEIFIGGNWTNNGGDAAFGEGTGIVHFTGSTEANIYTDETFYHVAIAKTSGTLESLQISPTYTVNVLNDLHIVVGTLELNLNTTLVIGNDLIIVDGAGLNANDVGANIMIYVAGNWTNHNTTTPSTTTGFDAGLSSTVIFNGTAYQYLEVAFNPETFANLKINNTGTSPINGFRPKDPLWIAGDLNIQNGEWEDFTFGQTHHIEGDITVDVPSGYGINAGNLNTTFVFTGTADQHIYADNISSQNPNFGPVIIDKISTKESGKINDEGKWITNNFQNTENKSITVTIHSDVQTANDELTIDEGILIIDGANFSHVDNVNINDGGTLNINSNGQLKLNNDAELNINSGGILEVIGTTGSPATITQSWTGYYYDFNVKSGGTISAEDAIFEYMNSSGIGIEDGATIDINHPFDNCTFQNGDNTGMSTLLAINNNQTLIIDGASFPINPGGTTSFNVAKSEDHGNITFTNASGVFAGPVHEFDTYNRIDWAGFIPGLWTGAVSSDWDEPLNWSDYSVPDETTNVSIPAGIPHDPVINTGASAYCKNLFLQSGASLTQNGGSSFYCYATFDAGYGQFTMNGFSHLHFRGGNNELWWDDNQDDTYTNIIFWKSSSTAKVTMQTNMTCSGWFDIREGTFEMLDDLTLTINNTDVNALDVENGGILNLESFNNTVYVEGGILFRDGSQLLMNTWSTNEIQLGGSLQIQNNGLYDIDFNYATLSMIGTINQYIRDFDGGNLSLGNLFINKPSGTCFIENNDLHVKGSVHINSGELSCRSFTGSATVFDIFVEGYWSNTVGDAGFDEATGRVIFMGIGDAYISSETFYELEIIKPGNSLVIGPYKDVICSAYDWTSGRISVFNESSFTANDLLDNAVQGEFYLSSGSTINLTNSGGSGSEYVDLKGDLTINGGIMNITGSFSYWPYQEDASIEMSDGILDFNNTGIRIDDNIYSLTTNITGGIIRTSGYFHGERTDFTPSAGIIELYGSSDAVISQSNGCTIYDLHIDKSSKEGSSILKPGKPNAAERSGEIISNGSKSNTASLNSDLVITNDLVINSGVLDSDNYAIYIEGDWTNNIGDVAFDEGIGTVKFEGSDDSYIYGEETFYNLSIYKSFATNLVRVNDGISVLNDVIADFGYLISFNTNTVSIYGDALIEHGGRISIQDDSRLELGDGSQVTVNSGGGFFVVGIIPGEIPVLTHISTGSYGIEVNLDGAIGIENAIIEYMDENGITVNTGANIYEPYTFNNTVFRNASASPSTILSIHNDQVLSCDKVYFENSAGNSQFNVTKTNATGSVTFTKAAGDFAGPEYENDENGLVNWSDMDVELDLTVLLEGPFNGTAMNTILKNKGLVPKNQPFSSMPAASWHYTGTESVVSVPPNVVDWVLIELRDAETAISALGSTLIVQQAAFLLNDGSVVNLDGISNLNFSGISYEHGLFPVIWHRNHLGVISSDMMARSGEIYTWDFSTPDGAFTNTGPGQKALNGGVYGMFSGDLNGDQVIDPTTDLSFWKGGVCFRGYLQADVDLNGQVDNKDKNDFIVPNLLKDSQIQDSK